MKFFVWMKKIRPQQIEENLFLGSGKNVLEEAEITLVCSEKIYKNYFKKHKHEVYIDSAGVMFSKNKDKIFFSLKDKPLSKSININLTKKIINYIDISVNKEKKITYIHCKYGVNRSVSHVFMYMIAKKKINKNSFKEALKEFKEKFYKYAYPIFGWKTMLKKYYPYIDFLNK